MYLTEPARKIAGLTGPQSVLKDVGTSRHCAQKKVRGRIAGRLIVAQAVLVAVELVLEGMAPSGSETA